VHDAHDHLSLNGSLVAADTAGLSVLDHGFTVGDGVFETMKVTAREPFAMARHLRRLRRSAHGLGIEVGVDDDELRARATEVLAANDVVVGRLRITVTSGVAPLGSGRGGSPATIVLATADLPVNAPSTDVVTVPWTRNERAATAGLKTTSYADNVIALARANAEGCSEALLANTAGMLCEGTGSNVFVVADGVLVTPPLRSGCLAGITRELVLEAVPRIVEADLPFAELDSVSEAFLTSSTRDVQAIGSIDGRPLTTVGGPATRAAADAFAALAAAASDP